MKRVIYFLLVPAMLAACSTPLPQSRDELKASARDHARVMIYETYTSNRRFEEVVATLQGKWEQCYGQGKAAIRSESGTSISKYRDAMHPHFLMVNSLLFEMSLQLSKEETLLQGRVATGSGYIVALDVERLLGGKTQLSWHSSAATGWKEQWELNKQWSDGKDAACL